MKESHEMNSVIVAGPGCGGPRNLNSRRGGGVVHQENEQQQHAEHAGIISNPHLDILMGFLRLLE